MIGLILLGVGWNFTFVTATSLLVISYDEKDKFKVQGLNDFIVLIVLLTFFTVSG